MQVVGRGSWEVETTLSPKTALDGKEMFTTAAWSEDGSALVAGTSKGRIVVWSVPEGVVKRTYIQIF